MNRKVLIIVICTLGLVVIGGSIALYFATTKQHATSTETKQIPPLRTNDELMSVVLAKKPSFVDENGTPTIKFAEEPQRLENNWYVLRIKPVAYENDHARILLYDDGGEVSSIKYLLGPGTSFTDAAFSSIQPPVPEIVRSEMNR